MTDIHSTAIVSRKAKIGSNVKIAPYAIIKDDVEIGDDCIVGPHTVIHDGARIGNRVKFSQSVSVSDIPQDLKFKDEKSYFHIGDDTTVREFVTLHRASIEGESSRVGKNCLLMAYVHIAHDCIIGDNVVIANAAQLGGHVEIDDWVVVGGVVTIHQFVKVGKHCMIGGSFKATQDIPPFVKAASHPIKYSGINSIGLKRRGFTSDEIFTIKKAYQILYKSGLNISQGKAKIAEDFAGDPHVEQILEFLNKSTRGGFN
jgi:UDP-N-acetylglucosamine acyltransferase